MADIVVLGHARPSSRLNSEFHFSLSLSSSHRLRRRAPSAVTTALQAAVSALLSAQQRCQALVVACGASFCVDSHCCHSRGNALRFFQILRFDWLVIPASHQLSELSCSYKGHGGARPVVFRTRTSLSIFFPPLPRPAWTLPLQFVPARSSRHRYHVLHHKLLNTVSKWLHHCLRISLQELALTHHLETLPNSGL